jgi:outer membrane murein-binding lipoprotein Lpp
MKTSMIVSLRSGIAAIAASLMLAGCGLAETAAVTAAEAETAAAQAKQGKEMEAKVERDIDAANKTAAEARTKAEADSE